MKQTGKIRKWLKIVGICTLVLFAGTAALADKREKQLSKQYSKWLKEDVCWIISKTERDIFFDLKSDTERDRFIQLFWEARDPTPGTPRNEFHEEHYNRLEYANAHFGREGIGPGWKTDRGRIYIQLGPPSQVLDWSASYEIYPCELWFYLVRGHPSLPNNFYILFYQREGAGGYRLYSPYMDGPEKLVHATYNDRRQCWEYLKSMSGELARASMCFLPNEPVDTDQLTPSMTSDLLVAGIFKLPEEEAPLQYLNTFMTPNSKLQEKVKTRLSFQFIPMQAAFFPMLDDRGQALLHYAFLIEPQNLSIARYKEEYYSSLTVSVDVMDEKGKTLLHTSQDLVHYYSAGEFQKIQSLPLMFEDKVGVVPGQYKVDIIILNKINGQTYRFNKSLEVPDTPVVAPAVSQLVLVDRFAPAGKTGTSLGDLCFTFFGYTFTPLLDKVVSPVQKLNVLCQFYYPPDKAKQEAGEALTLEYRLVDVATAKVAKTVTDSVLKGNFNAVGCLLNFKQIPMTEVGAGRYTLVVSAKEPSGRPVGSSNISFNVDAAVKGNPPRSYASELLQTDASGIYDYHRASILGNLGRKDEAMRLMNEAFVKSAGLTAAAVELARMELESGNVSRALELLEKARQNKDFPAAAHILLARAYVKSGRPADGQASLDAFLAAGSKPSRQEYQELAELYTATGNEAKAADMRRMGLIPEGGK